MENDFFECEGCGYCCHGETTVSLDENDRRRLSDYLGMPYDDVEAKFLRRTGKVVQMKTVDGHCIFYQEGCKVHPGKPWRCSQWPLHPSILTDPANFEAISTSCPGVRKTGTYEEFCRKFVKYLEDQES